MDGFSTVFLTSFATAYFPGATLTVSVIPETYIPTIFEEDLESYLSGALGVPVWPGILPAGIKPIDLPALVYTLVSADEQDEDLKGPTDIGCWNVQFDAYGRTLKDAARLIESLKAEILGYAGMMGTVEVLNVTRGNQSHGFDPLPSKSGSVTQRRMAEYDFYFRETTPSFP